MSEYISKESVLKAFKLTAKNPNKDYQRGMQDTIDCLVPQVIADIPSADVQPVKRGKWDGYICSECNVCADYFISGDFYFDEKPNFCPNCGARMDGDKANNVRNLTDEETEIYESWIDHEAKDTGVNIMDGEKNG